jgi:hypothetical protein
VLFRFALRCAAEAAFNSVCDLLKVPVHCSLEISKNRRFPHFHSCGGELFTELQGSTQQKLKPVTQKSSHRPVSRASATGRCNTDRRPKTRKLKPFTQKPLHRQSSSVTVGAQEFMHSVSI